MHEEITQQGYSREEIDEVAREIAELYPNKGKRSTKSNTDPSDPDPDLPDPDGGQE
ncbi:MAG: hypothetical protein MI861_08770 [Pirellulales bacterium]|nr:hypothetical protein [Pirellulales bacterium]